MKRAEMLILMRERMTQLADLGQAVVAAAEATEPKAEDLAAMMTAADQAKALADQFGVVIADAKGKERRLADEFTRAVRLWSAGVGALADGFAQQSPKLVLMGKQWFNQAVKLMEQSTRKLA